MISMTRMYCRAFQSVFNLGARLLKWRMPSVESGVGSVSRIPALLRGQNAKRPMIVTGPRVRRLLLPEILKELDAAGIEYQIFSDVENNPTSDTCEKIRDAYLASGCDSFLAVGGGSPMDAAKAAAALVARPGKTVRALSGLLKVRRAIPPFIAVPTTAGTGSETTIAAVITDSKTHHKAAMMDLVLVPRCAVLDPVLTAGLPQQVTAATGMDALTHAIEGFITKGAWEMTDMFHLKAIEIIARSLRSAVAGEAEGFEGMALGQYVAGMGFSNVGLGIVHSMAHTLGAVYDTPHGVGNAILLPTIMEYNAPVTGDKYKYIAAAMGVEGVESMTQDEYRKAACDAVRKLSADVGIPADLKDIVKLEDLDFLAESAYADACRPGNPRDTSVEEIKQLFLKLM